MVLLQVLCALGCSASANTVASDAPADLPADAVVDVPDAPSLVDVPDVPAVVDVPASTDVPTVTDAPMRVPIEAPDRTWTWVDLAGTACDDGSPTGMGVNLVAGATGTLVYLNGGGYCFDYATCVTLNTSAHGPFGRAQFAALTGQLGSTVLDRDLAANPFAGFNLVVVPYCTGDLHAGEGATIYGNGASARTLQHVGRRNLRAVLQRLAAAIPAPATLVLAGSGAGGFGATLNHALAREVFPGGALSVVADSGPLLAGDAVPAAQRAAWFSSWHLGWIDPSCPRCRDDLSALYPALAARYPADSTALVGSLQDRVTRTFFGQSAAVYEGALRSLATALAPLAGRRVFAVPGEGTALLARPGLAPAGDGTALLPWLGEMVTGAGSWASHGP
jgi:hypothetical protein